MTSYVACGCNSNRDCGPCSRHSLTIIFVENPEPSGKVRFVVVKKTFYPILDVGRDILEFGMPVPMFYSIFSLLMPSPDPSVVNEGADVINDVLLLSTLAMERGSGIVRKNGTSGHESL